jgi:ElaB/YqjD/DUF883 family membrane-anchored ribosome-binding protein
MTSKTTDIDDIREGLAELRSELKSLMKTINRASDDTVGIGSGIAQQVSRIAGDLEETARRTYDRLSGSVSEGAQHYGRSLEKAIADHPFSAATIALAAGVILSRFLERSDR